MFCTMENNIPIYINLNHHIFYNLNTFHMNEFLNFYNNLWLDSLTRMIFFLLNSKKIVNPQKDNFNNNYVVVVRRNKYLCVLKKIIFMGCEIRTRASCVKASDVLTV